MRFPGRRAPEPSAAADDAHAPLHAGLAAGAVEQIDSCRSGQRVTIEGTIVSVSLHPEQRAASLEAAVSDASGVVNIVWLGRRRIPGIEVGRTIALSGRITCPGRIPVIYNPRYELRPMAGESSRG